MTLPITPEVPIYDDGWEQDAPLPLQPEQEFPLAAPEDPEAPQDAEQLTEQRRSAMKALYGEDFPQAQELEPVHGDWARWAQGRWETHQAAKRRRMHLVERNRLFRRGTQWISSTNLNNTWREPPRPKDVARVVDNVVAPALDQRVQLIAEQRPGLRTRPTTGDQDDLKKAEAQQLALEYSYDEQHMADIIRETAYWVGTDGVAFWLVYWDADAGPWHEYSDGSYQPMGDVRTRVLRIDQVVVSANATATQKPTYWVVKERLPTAEAVSFHGQQVVYAANNRAGDGVESRFSIGVDPLWDSEMLEGQDTIDRYMVFCERSEYLPNGLLVVVVGDKEVLVSELPVGCSPMIRVTDGSSDPAFYPTPIMDGWVDHQVRINTLKSKWVDSIRVNSGGKFFAKPKAVSTDTLVGGLHTFVEVRGAGTIQDNVLPVPGFSVGNDVKEALAMEYAAFEAKSGWSAASRGQFSGDTSGRAILASREALERVFAEPINSMARSMTEWGKISLKWMKWGYDLPRTLGSLGKGRPDLARELTQDDLDGACDVTVDPETMMPMPQALKMFLLDNLQQKGALSVPEYRRRMPFGWIRDIQTPDEDHLARARRVAEAIRNMQPPPPMKWQDNEAIHQDVLEREILLRDDLPPEVQMAAHQRWVELANQAMMKMGGMPPMGGAPAPQPGGKQSSPFAPSPARQPLLKTNPGIPAAPVGQMLGDKGQQFDSTRPF